MNHSQFIFACLLAAGVGVIASGCAGLNKPRAPKKVLLVDATLEFHHDAIPMSEKILTNLGLSSGTFTIVDTISSGERPKDSAAAKIWEADVKKRMAEAFTTESLKNYDAVIFDSTTGNLLSAEGVDTLITWITNGGAFIGMHAATDTLHGSRKYIDLIGGEFKTHGAQVKVDCINLDPQHPATRHFGTNYSVFDEIYQFKNYDTNHVHGLLTMDKHPNNHTPGDYPVSWCKAVGKGKVFYTSLGHRQDVWSSDEYQKHILGGIKWALGLEPGSAIPQIKPPTAR